jgi:hypothetical protein
VDKGSNNSLPLLIVTMIPFGSMVPRSNVDVYFTEAY